ncbi:MAG: site-specific integrase [Hyphomicrobiales bacterium]
MATKKRLISIDAVKRLECNEILWDTRIIGFGIRRQKSASLTYIVKVRVNNKQRWFVIGRHGSPWTPDTARREALRILGGVAEGQDLASIRDEKKSALTMSELCDAYIGDARSGKILTKFGSPKKKSTIDTDSGRILRHITPLLGKKLVNDVTNLDVKRFMNDIAVGKTATNVKTGSRGRAIVRGGRGAATRTVGLLGGIFSYAIENGMRREGDNPVQGIKKFPDQKEMRFLTSVEFSKLGTAMTELEDDGINPYGLVGVRLLMLTGCRKSEILTLKWDYVDFENFCLRLPDTKTGEKVLILGTPALDLLNTVPRLIGNPYVLVGQKKGQHLIGLPKIWNKIREKAGLDWATLHILRHSFASFGAGSGLGLPIIGHLLGHKDTTTTARYAKIATDPAKIAADKIASKISAAIDNS